MSRLICIYDHAGKSKAVKKCDVCGVLMCGSCGYVRGLFDFCNKCWVDYGDVYHVIKQVKGGETK